MALEKYNESCIKRMPSVAIRLRPKRGTREMTRIASELSAFMGTILSDAVRE